jgi:dihydroorotase-like cyclic amidohydrolase
MSKVKGIEIQTTGNPARTESIYRIKWLEAHRDADVIVVDELSRLPVRAEYNYPADFEQKIEVKVPHL